MSVLQVVVIPSYCEPQTLPLLLRSLDKELPQNVAIVVIDDSPTRISATTEELSRVVINPSRDFAYVARESKLGRGNAIRVGMEVAIQRHPKAQTLLECDADGSHRPSDVKKLLFHSKEDLICIGSRYLPSSRIIGWSLFRRINSRILNIFIPFLFRIPSTDVTNGLRAYPRSAVINLLSHESTARGFIALTEDLLLLKEEGFQIRDFPIVFEERHFGKSSVRLFQLFSELRDLFSLYSRYRLRR